MKMHKNVVFFIVPVIALLTPWMQKSLQIVENSPKNNQKLINQISELYMFLNPDNSIQERKENLISFYDLNFIENLMENLDPLDLQFKILKK